MNYSSYYDNDKVFLTKTPTYQRAQHRVSMLLILVMLVPI